MILIAAICLLAGLIAEIISVDLFFSNFIDLSLLAHLVASIFITFSMVIFLRGFFKKEYWAFYLFTFLVCFFVPLSGLVIGLFIVIAIFALHNKFHKYAEPLDLTFNLQEIKPVQSKYGPGGAIMRLKKADETTLNRTKALFAVGEGQLAHVNKIMYELLPDNSDEIRLLAFNILDQQENVITNDINKLLSILETPNLNPVIHAKFEKNLAMIYWELVYRRLILRELEQSMLKKAQHYALSAVKVLKDDATAWALLGKIYQRLNEYKLAEEAFNKTTIYNISPSHVLPYLAEIKYKLHDYVEVQKYLDESDTLLDVALMAPVKRFWDNQ